MTFKPIHAHDCGRCHTGQIRRSVAGVGPLLDLGHGGVAVIAMSLRPWQGLGPCHRLGPRFSLLWQKESGDTENYEGKAAKQEPVRT